MRLSGLKMGFLDHVSGDLERYLNCSPSSSKIGWDTATFNNPKTSS
jgi:hypothetical protein